MRRIPWIAALLVLCALGIRWYIQRARLRALNSGDVYIRPQQPSGPRQPLPSPAAAARSLRAPQVASATPQRITGAPPAIPPSDTIPRNPPNGTAFTGSGKFVLYRQGDITWRLNTETGDACILFATDAEWSRARVFQHGCRHASGPAVSASLKAD